MVVITAGLCTGISMYYVGVTSLKVDSAASRLSSPKLKPIPKIILNIYNDIQNRLIL